MELTKCTLLGESDELERVPPTVAEARAVRSALFEAAVLRVSSVLGLPDALGLLEHEKGGILWDTQDGPTHFARWHSVRHGASGTEPDPDDGIEIAQWLGEVQISADGRPAACPVYAIEEVLPALEQLLERRGREGLSAIGRPMLATSERIALDITIATMARHETDVAQKLPVD